jgi:hypothetical protein
VSGTLRRTLGPQLAAWLEHTRQLHSATEALHRFALEMLVEERARGFFPRDVGRRVDDANFLVRIREVRELAHRWRDDAVDHQPVLSALPDPIRLPWDELDPALELPWGLTVEHDRKADRSDEIEVIASSTASLTRALREIDATLTQNSPGYR